MKSRFLGGSVLGFVVVGTALVALLLVGAYATKRYVAQNNQGEVAVSDSHNASTDKSDKDSDQAKKDQKSDSDDQAKAPQESAGDAGDQQSSQDEAAVSDEDMPTAGVEMPQTGPGGTVSSVLGLAGLSGAGVFYVTSRRQS